MKPTKENKERANRAEVALCKYSLLYEEDKEATITDLMTDLIHLASQLWGDEKAVRLYDKALKYYDAETGPDAGDGGA